MKIIALLLGLFCLPPAFGEITADNKPDNDALSMAVISSNWSWEENTTGTKRVQGIQFYQGGSALNTQFLWTAHWDVATPRVLVIENTRRDARYFGHKTYLVFDADFTHFVGFDFNGRTTVEGFRREAVDPKRQPPEAKEQ